MALPSRSEWGGIQYPESMARVSIGSACVAGILFGFLLFSVSAHAQNVFEDAASTEPLQPGANVPSVYVEALSGAAVDLASLTQESGALLVFYRGGW